jgi:PEP-CTERM motif
VNTLRIMPTACRSRITPLVILLLAGPSSASAQLLIATGGSASADSISPSIPFDAFGPGFSMAGDFFFNPLVADPCPCGLGTEYSFTLNGDILSNFSSMDISVSVASTGLTDVGGNAHFDAPDIDIPGPGTYTERAVFDAAISSDQGDFIFGGTGTLTYKVVATDTPGIVDLVSANYAITNPSNVPEPSTASLLFIGAAGLAVMGRRRKSHTTMIQTG